MSLCSSKSCRKNSILSLASGQHSKLESLLGNQPLWFTFCSNLLLKDEQSAREVFQIAGAWLMCFSFRALLGGRAYLTAVFTLLAFS